MFNTLSIAIIILEVCQITFAERMATKIVGGRPVDIKNFPYQVAIEASSYYICGGSIITKRHILTAAHCLAEFSHKMIQVRAGSSLRLKGGVVKNVAEIRNHPYYNDYDYDIGVITLEDDLAFKEDIRAINLTKKGEEIKEGTVGVVTGWGISLKNNITTNNVTTHQLEQLQAVDLQVVGLAKCQQWLGNNVTIRMICAGYEEGESAACMGDDGGPLVINNKVFGVFSWGFGCGYEKKPSVFSSVAKLRDFIDKAVNS